MFRPSLATIRFISEWILVFLTFMWLCNDGDISSSLVLIITTIIPLTPYDHYSGRTAPLTSKRFILCIYSTNIGIEYFKHDIYSLFFLFKMQFVS